MYFDGENKGTQPVILTQSKTNPIQKFLSLLESRRNAYRGQGASITHRILDYICLLLIVKKQQEQITLIFLIDFYQFIYC